MPWKPDQVWPDNWRPFVISVPAQALNAGFKELHRRYKMHSNPADYVDDNPLIPANALSPLSLAIDAIAEAGMIPQTINLYTDKRVRATALLKIISHILWPAAPNISPKSV